MSSWMDFRVGKARFSHDELNEIPFIGFPVDGVEEEVDLA